MMVDSLAVRITIRPMVADDLERVHEIDELSFSATWPVSSYRFELFENPAGRLWVAETQMAGEEKKVVGMIVVWLLVDETHIASIAVHPDYRGHGIGRKLLVTALRASFGWGAHMATLEVRESNVVAQTMYRDFGFEIVGRRPRYYIDNNEDALIMSLDDMDEEYFEWLGE